MAPEMTVSGVSGATARPLRPRLRGLALSGCLALAVALGVLAEVLGYLPPPWMYLSQVIVMWLAGAFASGACTRRPIQAAAAGAAFITVGLITNTAFKALISGRDAVRPMIEHEWPVWLALALVLGGGFGATGWVRASKSGSAQALAAAVIVAAGLAEVGANVIGLLPWGRSVSVAVGGLVCVVTVLVFRGLRAGQMLLAGVSAALLAGAVLLALPVLQAMVSVA